jgi:DMSO/TMAO reductase YedYZ molybdopterin-dependent catalytic subunit
MIATRRQILGGFVGSGGGWLLGCGSDPGAAPPGPDPTDTSCTELFARGTLLATLSFTSEATAALETPLSSGLDGRLYTDLEKLRLLTTSVENDRFYIRTRYPDRLVAPASWIVRLGGLVETKSAPDLASLLARARPLGVTLLECSGNGDFARFGMLSAADWGGVPLTELLQERVKALPGGTRVRVSGNDDHSAPSAHSTPGASWIFSFDELASTKAFLATTMNGAPLPPDHGAPVRLVVPGWYGCTCIKWVDAIDLVGEDEPATSQMTEFAARTMQNGTPALARDFQPAAIDQTAMPVRVERWSVDGAVVHRIVGLMWGGSRPTDALAIRINDGAPERVALCATQVNTTWTWWSHAWRPPGPGTYAMTMKIEDATIRTRRLDTGFYARSITLA